MIYVGALRHLRFGDLTSFYACKHPRPRDSFRRAQSIHGIPELTGIGWIELLIHSSGDWIVAVMI